MGNETHRKLRVLHSLKSPGSGPSSVFLDKSLEHGQAVGRGGYHSQQASEKTGQVLVRTVRQVERIGTVHRGSC